MQTQFADAVNFDNVGSITTLRDKEKQDEELKKFEEMMKAKKKKKKEKEKAKKTHDINIEYTQPDMTAIDDYYNDNNTNKNEDDNDHTNCQSQMTNNNYSDYIDLNHANITNDSVNNVGEINTNCLKNDDIHDYPYTFLLDRIYHQLYEKNEKLFKKENYKLPVPQIHFIGTRKTGWSNFNQICMSLKRKPDDVKQFFLVEMSTTGSLDGNGNLILKGRWRPKQFEKLLKKYIREYVECHSCHSPETVLIKDIATRLLFLRCKVCGCERSVTQIKAGFHAISRDDRRQAQRNAQ